VWSQPGYLPNEPYFVSNPNGKSEDDGFILTVAYDFRNDRSRMLAIDTQKMETAKEFDLPFRIPWSFHSGFWAKDM